MRGSTGHGTGRTDRGMGTNVKFANRIAIRSLVLAAAGGAAMLSGTAYANSAAVDYFRTRANQTAAPSLLNQDERGFYLSLHEAIAREDWNRVQQMLAQKPDGLLTQHAVGEYYTAPTSPKIELPE